MAERRTAKPTKPAKSPKPTKPRNATKPRKATTSLAPTASGKGGRGATSAKGRKGRAPTTPSNLRQSTMSKGTTKSLPPAPPAAVHPVAALPPAFRPRAPHPFVRQGPLSVRVSSPPFDLTNVRVRRRDKGRLDRIQGVLSIGGRVPPQWEVFAFLVEAAEAALPPPLAALLAPVD